MGKGAFVWFQGVVEDRNDPLKLGRLRVRCLGWHTDDKSLIPTEALPWAHPMAPITSASISGIGQTPLGPVEGTWVIGFFRDGENAQEPVIMGTIGGIPDVPEGGKGFSDPAGVYPKFFDVPDTNELARTTEGEGAPSLFQKRQDKIGDVPIARAPKNLLMSPAIPDAKTDKTTWSEPNPRYGGQEEGEYVATVQSSYPYNHVRMSEAGMVEEWDDTPGANRTHSYHPSGTFEEIQHTGDKITKVTGDDFELFIKDKSVYIGGTCSVTIKGDSKLYVQGDHYLEVDGNYYETVRKDKVITIGGSEVTEIVANRVSNVNKDQKERVGQNKTETTIGSFSEQVGLTHFEKIIGNNTIINVLAFKQTSGLDTVFAAASTMDLGAGTDFSAGGGATVSFKSITGMNVTAGTTMNTTSGGVMGITGSQVRINE
jgi:hypothetical protein